MNKMNRSILKIYFLTIISTEIGALLYRWNILPEWFSMSALLMFILMIISILSWDIIEKKIDKMDNYKE